MALDTEQELPPHTPVSIREDHPHQVHNPASPTSTDQNTVVGDVTREVSTGPAQDVTRASSSGDIGDGVVMRISEKPTPSEHAVAVTTQEALDGCWTDTVSEKNTFNWVSISAAGTLDVTHCDFSVRSAWDEMRHFFGSSEPDVIIGTNKDQNRACRKRDRDHMEFQCELYDRKWRAVRFIVHELTSEVELENVVRAEDHGHARNEKDSGGPVHV